MVTERAGRTDAEDEAEAGAAAGAEHAIEGVQGIEGIQDILVGTADLNRCGTAWHKGTGVLIVNSRLPVLEQLAAIGRWAEARLREAATAAGRNPSDSSPRAS